MQVVALCTTVADTLFVTYPALILVSWSEMLCDEVV